MSGLLLPMLLFAVALAATFLTYRNIRRGGCLLYTSDAADERSRVDFGGRRILKKKTKKKRKN